MPALTLPTVARLLTANSHPIDEIKRHNSGHSDDIEIWLRQQFHAYLVNEIDWPCSRQCSKYPGRRKSTHPDT